MVRQRVVVHGRVQGVLFRDSCLQQATVHEVSGWVRNRADGAVEAVFEGEREAVETLTAWCRRGPRHAQVERIDVAEEQPTGERGFEVL
ncbi:MAG: acylphosphatase [Nocardioidaceae bacterium]